MLSFAKRLPIREGSPGGNAIMHNKLFAMFKNLFGDGPGSESSSEPRPSALVSALNKARRELDAQGLLNSPEDSRAVIDLWVKAAARSRQSE
jgi:hypothetical protein